MLRLQDRTLKKIIIEQDNLELSWSDPTTNPALHFLPISTIGSQALHLSGHLNQTVNTKATKATLLGIGIWVTVDSKSFLNIFAALSASVLQFVYVGYLLIAIGAVLFLLGFLGCCGAQKESKCLLIMFFSIVLIIFIIEVAGAVVALVYTSLAETVLQATVTKLLKDDYGKPNPVTEALNITMTEGCFPQMLSKIRRSNGSGNVPLLQDG
ncbi:Tetraspanin-1, partial [Ophiophagus hannah]